MRKQKGRVMFDGIKGKYSSLVPPEMTDELFSKDGLDPKDQRIWVPIVTGRWSRPLCLNVSQGYWVHITKVTDAGIISRHRHPAPVHGFVIEGRWRYVERDWVAIAGSYQVTFILFWLMRGIQWLHYSSIQVPYYIVMKMEKLLALRMSLIEFKLHETIMKRLG